MGAARVAEQGASYLRDSLAIVSTSPIPPQGSGDDSTRHWKVIAVAIVLTLAFIFCLGVGYGQGWGAQQWGPFSDWLVGLLTFGAVVVALRESLKAQHSRLIDHELARRRENLDALANLWAALLALNMPTFRLGQYFDNFPETFDPASVGNAPSEHLSDYMATWIETVEPARFVALTLLKNTSFGATIVEFEEALTGYMTELLEGQYKAVSIRGRRPENSLSNSWHSVSGLRHKHLDLARQHFSLDIKDVEAAVRRR